MSFQLYLPLTRPRADTLPKHFDSLIDFFARKSKQREKPSSVANLDKEAIVTGVLRQGEEWRVRYVDTLWRARSAQGVLELQPDDRVYVVGRQNLTLLIQKVV